MDTPLEHGVLALLVAVSWVVAITHYRLIRPIGLWRIAAIGYAAVPLLISLILSLLGGASAGTLFIMFLLSALVLILMTQRSMWTLEESFERQNIMIGDFFRRWGLLRGCMLAMVAGVALMVMFWFIYPIIAGIFLRPYYRRRLVDRLREVDADREVCCRVVRDPFLRFALWLARQWVRTGISPHPQPLSHTLPLRSSGGEGSRARG